MDDPLAYFLTWTTYGSWLSGDQRGWIEKPGRFMAANKKREEIARERMRESELTLDHQQRDLVEQTITEHCERRGWYLHAARCRTQHAHVVVTAPDLAPKVVLDQFKAWCTRRLKEHEEAQSENALSSPGPEWRERWWTVGGSKRKLFTQEALDAAIRYVLEEQDCPR